MGVMFSLETLAKEILSEIKGKDYVKIETE